MNWKLRIAVVALMYVIPFVVGIAIGIVYAIGMEIVWAFGR